MKYTTGHVVRWVAAYLACALAPMVLAMVGSTPAPRPFLTEVGVGLGFVGIGLVALQLVITGRFRSVTSVFGADVVLQFHRQIGIVAVVLVLAHPIVLIASNPDFLEFFDPRANFLRALALTAVVPALVLVLVTSLWRELVRLNYEWWRLSHGVLALAIVFIGMIHGIQVGEHLDSLWKQVVWAAALVGLMYLVVHTRVVRPALMRRRPYRVTEVRRELPDVFSLVIEPDGHAGMDFSAGQFAWMTVGSSPFSLQQHPFSFSSSEHSAELSFTAKALGDFTESWQHMETGECVYLEGPFGGFTLDDRTAGAVFIVGGIGVTPAMSVLRTMRDRHDDRPVLLVYANPDVEAIAFHDELEELRDELDLEVVHVLEDPPGSWSHEVGLVDRDLLERTLPPDGRAYGFYLCGPKPMMDATEEALRDMGLSWRQIYSERFQIV